MQYFYRAHSTPESILEFAATFFTGRGFSHGTSSAEHALFSDRRGKITVHVETEGGHYTRVTVSTPDVGESELDRVAKRFLAELHSVEDRSHKVRGGY
ncbi:MAG TPA: hypothetical protein VNL98_00965 [Gemmatimonadales bacterium]|nr:hypothetical protein [Gemmatimonadales bacterium]